MRPSGVDPALTLGDPNLFRRGTVPLGQELLTGRPLLMDTDDICRHVLVVGTTGSGKTELLTGMAAGVILAGGGVIFVDGKGDLSNWARMAGLAAQAGRADEAFLINMGGGPSSSWNPFTGLKADEAARLLVSSQSVATGDQVMWQSRANALIRVACRLAWYGCDQPNPEVVEYNMMPRILFTALKDMPNMPRDVAESVKAYLDSLPGYTASRGAEQSHVTMEQHGYLSMQWTATFDFLCRQVGHVLNKPRSDVNAEDAVRRRRIVHVSLPVLTMGGSDVKLAGGLIFAAIRRAVAGMTPQAVSGAWDEMVPDPSAASHMPPMLIILDEVGHYLVDGMGLMAAQARSTGIGLVFAVQDLDAMWRSDAKETSLITANAGTRIIMRQTAKPSDFMRPLLPSQHRTSGNYRRAIEESARQHLAATELAREREAMSRTSAGMSELHAYAVDNAREHVEAVMRHPHWDLEDVLPSLGAGEFVAVRGTSHVIGRAHYATPAIPPVHISLPCGEALPWALDPLLVDAVPEVDQLPPALSTGVHADLLDEVLAQIAARETASTSTSTRSHSDFVKDLLA